MNPYLQGLLAFFFTFSSLATSYNIEDASGRFKEDKGSLKANLFDIGLPPLSLIYKEPDFILERSGKELTVSQNDFALTFNFGEESILNNLESFQLESTNFRYTPGKVLHFSTEGMQIELGEGLQQIDDLKLDCEQTEKEVVKDIIPICLSQGLFTAPVINLDEISGKGLFKAMMGEEKSSSSVLSNLEDIQLSIINGNVNLSLKAKFIFRLTIRIQAKATYDEVKDILTLDIERARAGFIPVRQRLLREIQEAGWKGVTVNENQIKIQF